MPLDPLEQYKYKEKLKLNDLELPTDNVQKVVCPTCSQGVPADNLNIDSHIAKCNTCDVIFSFSETVKEITSQHQLTEEVLQPEGVSISQFGGDLDISVQQPWTILEILFVSFFPLLMVVIPALVAEFFPSSALSKVGLVLFFIASITGYIAYFFIRKRHKVYVYIDDDYLHIERRPKKLIKDKSYPIKDIDQVYIKNASPGNSLFTSVNMIVNGKDGQQHIELIKSVNSRSKAKYIEQEIERKLGIKNRSVPEEGS